MLGDKQEHFEGKGTDQGALQSHIEEYLKNDGFTAVSYTHLDVYKRQAWITEPWSLGAEVCTLKPSFFRYSSMCDWRAP